MQNLSEAFSVTLYEEPDYTKAGVVIGALLECIEGKDAVLMGLMEPENYENPSDATQVGEKMIHNELLEVFSRITDLYNPKGGFKTLSPEEVGSEIKEEYDMFAQNLPMIIEKIGELASVNMMPVKMSETMDSGKKESNLFTEDPFATFGLGGGKNYGKNLSLVYPKFIKYVYEHLEKESIEGAKRMMPKKGDVTLDDYSFIDFYDIPFGQTWKYDADKKEYFRMENGKRINGEFEADMRTNCYSTYLNSDDEGKCIGVAQCILNGDFKSLNRCMNFIKDEDMWKVASSDVVKVPPKTVGLVLKKFGVQGYRKTDDQGKSYIVPMSYGEWMDMVVNKMQDKKTAEAIKGNRQLLNYIRALIAICTDNLSILNKNNPVVQAKSSVPAYFKDLGMNKYKVPLGAGKDRASYSMFAASLKSAAQSAKSSNSLANVLMSGYGQNVHVTSPTGVSLPMATHGILFGGDLSKRPLSSSSSQFKGMMESVTVALSEVGIELHPNDKERIGKAIDQLSKYETQLSKLYLVLQTLLLIARSHGVTRFDKPASGFDKELSKFVSIQHVINYLKDRIHSVKGAMDSNIVAQNKITYDFMHNLFPKLWEDCADSGKSTEQKKAKTGDLVDLLSSEAY